MSGNLEDRVADLERRLNAIEPDYVDDLRDILRSYPGGIERLAQATGYHRESIYTFANATRSKAFPIKRAMHIARAFGDRRALGRKVTVVRLRSSWLRRFHENKEAQA